MSPRECEVALVVVDWLGNLGMAVVILGFVFLILSRLMKYADERYE